MWASNLPIKGLSVTWENWIDMDGAKTDHIVTQVRKCPSGALKAKMNKEVYAKAI